MMTQTPRPGAYLVITRLEKDPSCLGRKLVKHHDFRGNCGIPCTGESWPHACETDNHQNCDECVCNHCIHCPCIDPTKEKQP